MAAIATATPDQSVRMHVISRVRDPLAQVGELLALCDPTGNPTRVHLEIAVCLVAG